MKRMACVGMAVLASAMAMMPAKAQVVAYNWTGFYLGVNGGGGVGNADTDFAATTDATLRTRVFRAFGLPAETLVSDSTVSLGSFSTFGSAGDTTPFLLGGVQAGYLWQSDRFVFGAEVDIQATNHDGNLDICPVGCLFGTEFAAVNHRLDWFGTARAIAGVTQDRYLFYLTGGLAFGHVDSDYLVGLTGGRAVAFSTDSTRTGWTFGGGIKAMLGGNWSAKSEVLYYDLGDLSAASGAASSTITTVGPDIQGFTSVFDLTTSTSGVLSTRLTGVIFRLGVDYKFGGP